MNQAQAPVPSTAPRWPRVLVRVLLGGLGLLLACLLALWSWAGTEGALGNALRGVSAWLPQGHALSVQAAQGRLRGGGRGEGGRRDDVGSGNGDFLGGAFGGLEAALVGVEKAEGEVEVVGPSAAGDSIEAEGGSPGERGEVAGGEGGAARVGFPVGGGS